MTIIKEWCDGRKQEITFAEATRSLEDTYGTPSEIEELLLDGERLETCTAVYYMSHYRANDRIDDPRLKRKEAIRWK